MVKGLRLPKNCYYIANVSVLSVEMFLAIIVSFSLRIWRLEVETCFVNFRNKANKSNRFFST